LFRTIGSRVAATRICCRIAFDTRLQCNWVAVYSMVMISLHIPFLNSGLIPSSAAKRIVLSVTDDIGDLCGRGRDSATHNFLLLC